MKSVYERFILISEFFTAVIIGVGDVEPLNPRHSTPSVKLFEVITMRGLLFLKPGKTLAAFRVFKTGVSR